MFFFFLVRRLENAENDCSLAGEGGGHYDHFKDYLGEGEGNFKGAPKGAHMYKEG